MRTMFYVQSIHTCFYVGILYLTANMRSLYRQRSEFSIPHHTTHHLHIYITCLHQSVNYSQSYLYNQRINYQFVFHIPLPIVSINRFGNRIEALIVLFIEFIGIRIILQLSFCLLGIKFYTSYNLVCKSSTVNLYLYICTGMLYIYTATTITSLRTSTQH